MQAPSGESTLPPVWAARRPRSLAGSVPRHIGWIEPWIGGAVAIYTALLLAVHHLTEPVLWGCVVFAALLALWSWYRPARRQSALLVRAASFAAAAFVVPALSTQDTLLPGNSLAYWVVMPTLLYVFLLQTRLAWMLLGLNLLAFFTLVLVTRDTLATGQQILLRASFIFVFVAAAIRISAMLRRTDELLEARRIDAASGMLNEYGFLDHGGELWRHCRNHRTTVSLIFLDLPDLRRARDIYGPQGARMAADRVTSEIGRLDIGRNVVARISQWRFALLVPGAGREQAEALVETHLGLPPQVALDESDLEAIFPVYVHVVESKLQGIAFSRFYETETELLDSRMDRLPVTLPSPDGAGLEGPFTQPPFHVDSSRDHSIYPEDVYPSGQVTIPMPLPPDSR